MQRQCTLLPMMSDIELLSIQFQTLFLTTGSGRIERENDPDHSQGPRLYLAGYVSGLVVDAHGFPLAVL
jgi:hypothetical protein